LAGATVSPNSMEVEPPAAPRACPSRTRSRPSLSTHPHNPNTHTDTVAAHQSGELKKLLAAAGISI
jgi:hypothetical protein